MKKTSTFLTAIVMTLTMILAVFSSYSGSVNQASALPLDYKPQSDSIYYFYDYYPTVGYNTLCDMYSDYYIYYDYKPVNRDEFNELVGDAKTPNEESYFWGFDENTIVIIDIKKFLPSPDTLDLLALILLRDQNCDLIIVTSSYDKYNYPHQTLPMSGVVFIKDNGEAVKEITDKLIDEISNTPFSRNQYRILLDNNLVGIDDNYAGELEQLYKDSLAVRSLFTALTRIEDFGGLFDYYVSMLKEEHGIKILVHIQDRMFIDILANDRYIIDSFRDIQFQNYEDEYETYPAAAMSFLRLNPDFYDLLLEFQSTDPDFPVFVIERDPIEFSDDGLTVITAGDNSAAEELLAAIASFI